MSEEDVEMLAPSPLVDTLVFLARYHPSAMTSQQQLGEVVIQPSTIGRAKKSTNFANRLFTRKPIHQPGSPDIWGDGDGSTLDDAVIGPNPAVRPLTAKPTPRYESPTQSRRPTTASTASPSIIAAARLRAESSKRFSETSGHKSNASTGSDPDFHDLRRAFVINQPGVWESYAQSYANGHFNLSSPQAPPERISHALYLSAPPPPRESMRLEFVDRLTGYWQSWSDERADEFVAFIKARTNVQHVIITLLDATQEHIKGSLRDKLPTVPRLWSLAAHTILSVDGMVILDMQQDWRFSANPLVRREPALRFYAGVPLVCPGGHMIGSVALLDSSPRKSFSDSQRVELQNLASTIMSDVLGSYGNQPKISLASKHQRVGSEGNSKSKDPSTQRTPNPLSLGHGKQANSQPHSGRLVAHDLKDMPDPMVQTPPESPYSASFAQHVAGSIPREYTEIQGDETTLNSETQSRQSYSKAAGDWISAEFDSIISRNSKSGSIQAAQSAFALERKIVTPTNQEPRQSLERRLTTQSDSDLVHSKDTQSSEGATHMAVSTSFDSYFVSADMPRPLALPDRKKHNQQPEIEARSQASGPLSPDYYDLDSYYVPSPADQRLSADTCCETLVDTSADDYLMDEYKYGLERSCSLETLIMAQEKHLSKEFASPGSDASTKTSGSFRDVKPIYISPEANFGLQLWSSLLGYDMMYIVQVYPVSDLIWSEDDLLIPGALEFRVLLSHGVEPELKLRFDPAMHLDVLRDGGYLTVQDEHLASHGYDKLFLAPLLCDAPVSQLGCCISGTIFGAVSKASPGPGYVNSPFTSKEIEILEGASSALKRILKMEPAPPSPTSSGTLTLLEVEEESKRKSLYSDNGYFYEILSVDGNELFRDDEVEESDVDEDPFELEFRNSDSDMALCSALSAAYEYEESKADFKDAFSQSSTLSSNGKFVQVPQRVTEAFNPPLREPPAPPPPSKRNINVS